MRSRALVLIAAVLTACGRSEEPRPAPERPAAAKSLPVEIVLAPEAGSVTEVAQREYSRAREDGRQVLVYVGAKWCEPCTRFHDAAKAGQLDGTFPGLRLVEFDLDRDRDRLAEAGYGSKMIPLFALPRADGTPAGPRMEGSVKGAGAVAQITPRLKQVLAGGDGPAR